MNELKTLYAQIIGSFHNWNGTILWSRIKVTLGTVLLTVQQSGADLSQFLDAKQIAAYQLISAFLIAEGIGAEYIRRRNANGDL